MFERLHNKHCQLRAETVQALENAKPWLARAGFMVTKLTNFEVHLASQYYDIVIICTPTHDSCIGSHHTSSYTGPVQAVLASIRDHVYIGTWWVWVGSEALCPIGGDYTPAQYVALRDWLADAKPGARNKDRVTWHKGNTMLEFTKNSLNHYISLTTEQEPMNTLNITDLIAADRLFKISVCFNNSTTRYDYKSEIDIPVGAKAVVDSPSSGLAVVSVVASTKGLATEVNFPKYKWIVDVVDTSRYEELLDGEQNLKAKIELKKRVNKIKQELSDIGFTESEVLEMMGLKPATE